MRNLEELREKIYPIPSLFAKDAVESNDGTPSLDYAYGFKPVSQQTYIERKEVNKFGELCSLESHYMQAGGVHSYSTPISNDFGGYPDRCLLYAYDGKYLHKVESTEGGNTKPFIDNAGNVMPNVIDCPVTKPNDTNPIPRILWKSVGNVFGITEGLFSLHLDYSKAQYLPQGSIITSDSFVIGFQIVVPDFRRSGKNYSPSVLPSLESSTTIDSYTLRLSNKGRCGSIIGTFPYMWTAIIGGQIVIGIEAFPIPVVGGGSGNYALYFFAKAGTSFSGIVMTAQGTPSDIKWVAIPIQPMVRESESTEGD